MGNYVSNIVLSADTADIVDRGSDDYRRGVKKIRAWHVQHRIEKRNRARAERHAENVEILAWAYGRGKRLAEMTREQRDLANSELGAVLRAGGKAVA